MKLSQLSGSTLVLGGAICWSLNSPLVKYLTLDPLLICALRSLIAGLFLLPFLRTKQIRWDGWLFLYSFFYCALCLSVIVSLSMTSAAIAVGMQYTASIWLFLISWLKTRSFRLRLFLPVLIIMIGVVFFMKSGGSGDSNSTGNLIALSEGVFFAGMTLTAPKVTKTNALGLTALGNLFTAVLLFAAVPAARTGLFTLNSLEWGLMLILGIVQVAGGYGLYNLGITRISAQKASILALWEMLLGPLWVALFLALYPSPQVLKGFAIILLGILLDHRLNAV